MFLNRAWYLGYEREDAQNGNLFRFERFDRLFVGRPQSIQRSPSRQRKSLDKLIKLYDASFGVFLGNCAADQQAFLSKDPVQRATVKVKFELWFDDPIFKFIQEGQIRFKGMTLAAHKTSDRQFPNLLKFSLPRWCVEDIDLHRWILGYGEHVKIIQPEPLVHRWREIAHALQQMYGDG